VALLMGPMSVLGSIFGVMVNVVFSDYIVFICMIIVLSFSFYKTLQKGIELRRKELGTSPPSSLLPPPSSLSPLSSLPSLLLGVMVNEVFQIILFLFV
jgi:uncharacterized membrane protein YfcA